MVHSMAKRGTGILFAKDARSDFMRLTGSRFDGMLDRLERKNLPLPKFTRDQFREHVLLAMGGHLDGAFKCRYCLSFYTLAEVAVDHEMPLSRGGSVELDNIGFPCIACNARKGSLTPTEYLTLLGFLHTIPLARIDILKRLEMSVKLAAGARSNAGVIGDLKKTGQWQAARSNRAAAKKSKMGAF